MIGGKDIETASRSAREILRHERARIVAFLEARGGHDVRVFGSLARGDDDVASDIDLLVDLRDGNTPASELLTVLGLAEELSELVGARIDIVTPMTLSESVREVALAEAIPL